MTVFYPHDFQTETWRRLEAHVNEQIAGFRADLESPALDSKPESSVRLRAKIAALKDILAIRERVEAQARAEGASAHTTT